MKIPEGYWDLAYGAMKRPAEPDETAEFPRTKALVLDPYVVSRKQLADMLLRLSGNPVDFANDSAGALERLKQGGVNVLFVDWSSKVDATTLARALRGSDSPSRYVPVIALLQQGDPRLVKAARDAGINELMLKPVTTEVLRSRLTTIVKNPRRFVEAPGFFGPERRRRSPSWIGTERRQSGGAEDADRRYAQRRSRTPEAAASDRRQAGGVTPAREEPTTSDTRRGER